MEFFTYLATFLAGGIAAYVVLTDFLHYKRQAGPEYTGPSTSGTLPKPNIDSAGKPFPGEEVN